MPMDITRGSMQEVVRVISNRRDVRCRLELRSMQPDEGHLPYHEHDLSWSSNSCTDDSVGAILHHDTFS